MSVATILQEVDRSFYREIHGALFWVPFSKDIPRFRQTYPKFQSTYVVAPSEELRKIGAYFISNWQQQQFNFTYSYDFVQRYLRQHEEGEEPRNFADTLSSFLIVYHTANAMPNRQLENMLCHTLHMRYLERRVSLVLMEKDNLPRVPLALVGQDTAAANFRPPPPLTAKPVDEAGPMC